MAFSASEAGGYAVTKKLGVIYLLGYIATIFAANWAITRFGIVSVGFGLYAPAGVYFAGLAFTLRDMTQNTLGKGWTVAAIHIGAGCSALVSPALAFASATAFLLSEGLDFAVYTPLAERDHWWAGVGMSNTVGLVVDTVVFLWLAFGSLAFFWGQVVGKLEMTALALIVLYHWRKRAVLPRNPSPELA